MTPNTTPSTGTAAPAPPSAPIPASALGVILFAHGSRDPLWFQSLESIKLAMAAAHPDRPVVLAYLEMASPTLMEAVNQLVQIGVNRLAVLPIFLGVGKHLRTDLPALIQAVKARHPGVAVFLQPAIGEQPGFATWVAALPLSCAPEGGPPP
jgi:sirohydrochlorin cobaltochelatase